MEEQPLRLVVLPGSYAVCRLSPGEPMLVEALHGDFVSVTRTQDEMSVVCPEGQAPAGATVEAGWRCLKAEGPLDFALSGVLAALAVPLAEAGISIFAVSTFDTDYLLVKAEALERAAAALAAAGHRVHQSTEKAEPQPEEPEHTVQGVTPEAVERMLRTRRESMRGRYSTDDSTDLLREARDERTEELSPAEREGCDLWTADERLWNSMKDAVDWVRWIGKWQPADTEPDETDEGPNGESPARASDT